MPWRRRERCERRGDERAPNADSRARRAALRGGTWGQGVHSRRNARSRVGSSVRRRRLAPSGRRLARFLADNGTLCPPLRARVRPRRRHTSRAAVQLRFLGEPARIDRPDVAEARLEAASTRRRGHHSSRGLPYDLEPDHPESTGAGVRRHRVGDIQRRCRCARGGDLAAHAGYLHRAHARESLRPRGGHAYRCRSTACGSSRTTATRSGRSTTESRRARSASLATFSFYPAHHITMGEGGCVVTSRPELEGAGRVLPRLGTRLLVRAGRGRHLREAVRVEARSAAAGLRPQVHLLAHWLQPEGDGHAGGGRCCTAPEASGIHRRPEAELAAAAGGTERRSRTS